MPVPQLVVMVSPNGYLQANGTEGGAQDALLFYLNDNPLQTICIDGYRRRGFCAVKVVPEESHKTDKSFTCAADVDSGKPLWYHVAGRELLVYSDDESVTCYESSLLRSHIAERLFNEFESDHIKPYIEYRNFELKPRGFLTEQDRVSFENLMK